MTAFRLPTATPDLYPTCEFPDSTLHRTNRCTCDWVGAWLNSERALDTEHTTDDPWAGVRG